MRVTRSGGEPGPTMTFEGFTSRCSTPCFVRGLQSAHEAATDGDRVGCRERTRSRDPLGERHARDERHHDAERVPLALDVEERGDAGPGEPSQHLGLVLEPELRARRDAWRPGPA